ncbi:MAG TPA: hypothetical protein VGL42_04985 [Opitutaceae bacterium]|jgi:ABC-type Mn2+/Zn2+ transport system permease subunit
MNTLSGDGKILLATATALTLAFGVYFTAGIPGPDGHNQPHGLFGSIRFVPDEASTLLALSAGLLAMIWIKRRSFAAAA